MTDRAFLVKFFHILDEFPVHDSIPLLDRVDIVDHAQVDIVSLKAKEKIFESRDNILHIPGPYILPVLIRGADMSLHIPGIPASGHGFSDDISRLRICHPAVHDVDALAMSILQKPDGMLFVMAFQPLAAKADLTHF
jgi:hypothetical protein